MRTKTYLSLLAIAVMFAGSVPLFAVQREDVKRLLKRLEENTDRFRKSLDDAFDHSALNGTRTEDELNGFVKDFENATDRLKEHYEDTGAAPNSAREVLLRAKSINQFMRRHSMGPRAEGDWRIVKSDLDTLARLYKIRWRW